MWLLGGSWVLLTPITTLLTYLLTGLRALISTVVVWVVSTLNLQVRGYGIRVQRSACGNDMRKNIQDPSADAHACPTMPVRHNCCSFLALRCPRVQHGSVAREAAGLLRFPKP